MHNPLDMAVFAKVVQMQSFSAAATYLEMSRSSVSKHVANLEKSLGVRLLTRTTRRLHVTEAGAAMYEHCARIFTEIEAGEITASLYAKRPRGLVRLSCMVAFGRLHVVPGIPQLLMRHPEIEVECIMTDRAVDLVAERIDIAITSDPLPSHNLAVRHLAPIRSCVCAAESYLKRHGVPKSPQDLQDHNCITYRSPVTTGRVWSFRHNGQEISVPVKGNFSANNNEGLREATLQGLGIAILPDFVLGPEDDGLRRLLPDYETVGLFAPSILLHYVSGTRTPPKVRACVDFFAERLSGDLGMPRITAVHTDYLASGLRAREKPIRPAPEPR